MSTIGVAHHKMLIGGEWVDSDQHYEIRSPATEEIVATVAKGTVDDADRAVESAKRAFRAGVPWQSTLHSWTLLDSHDSPRFRTVTKSREKQLVGVGLQMTTPGVPMVFAGDEIGLGGDWGEDARRTMPWSHGETWDTVAHDA